MAEGEEEEPLAVERRGAGSSSRGGRGGGKRGRPSGSGAGAGAKKPRTITPKYGVLDRVLLGLYDEESNIVGYLLGTVQSIYTSIDGCLYTLLLDRDDEEKKDVEEDALFKSVEAV